MTHSPRLLRVLLLFSLVCECILPPAVVAAAERTALERVRVVHPIASPYYPVVLRGAEVPLLRGTAAPRIGLYASDGAGLTPIPFQLDQRDEKGGFVIRKNEVEDAAGADSAFDDNDECAFMAADVGGRVDVIAADLEYTAALEIELVDPRTDRRGYVYALVFADRAPQRSPRRYVDYRREEDGVATETYRIGFQARLPMLVDTVQWKDPATGQWGPDVLDVMKVRHTGKFLHRYDFERNPEHYTSKLVGVRTGPVRIIRRTYNRVYLLLGLRSPTIQVDYVVYANAYILDMVLDIPFRIGWFFSEAVTWTSMDGASDASLGPRMIYTDEVPEGVAVDGRSTESEGRLNAAGARDFALVGPHGSMLVGTDFENDFPILTKVHVTDDASAAQTPEDEPGQHGNVGFEMTNWEALDTAPHHMVFKIYMVPGVAGPEGLRLLRDAPSFAHSPARAALAERAP